MNVNDQLKAKIDEIDVDAKLTQLGETAAAIMQTAKEQAASLIQDNRAKVDELIEKATSAIDEKTEGKYHDKVVKAKASFVTGLDKLQEAGAGADAGEPTAPGTEPAPFEESAMHVGEEMPVGGDSPADVSTEPEPAAQPGQDSEPIDVVGESDPEPLDPQAWANETDRPS
jgi:hypothetical protein